MEPTNGRELTYGEKAVGLTFNPANNPDVDLVKKTYASIIDFLNGAREKLPTESREAARLLSIAITEAQSAQMWAVKAITWN